MSNKLTCEACGSSLPAVGDAVPSHLPEFDLRHSICVDGYWAMVRAAKDPEVVGRFLDSRPPYAGQLPPARAWGDLEPDLQREFEAWIIEALRAQTRCTWDAAA